MIEERNKNEEVEQKALFIDSVIWRNWILPMSIGVIAGVLFKIAFIAMEWNEFFAGYWTCMVYFIAHKISSI